jgi:glutathione S-transferase
MSHFWEEGMITLYGSTLSPFVRKTMAVAAEKGIEVDLKDTGGFAKPKPEFLAASPFRKMPAMQDGDFSLCDSSAIIQYFEGVKPDPAMIPAEPRARARTIWFEEFADTILVGAAGKIFFNRLVAPRFLGVPGDEAAADKAEKEELPPIYDYLEGVVPASGFLVADRLTLADIAVASPFVNLQHLGLRPDAGRWPKMMAFVDAIHARPSFAPIIRQEAAFFGN